MDLVLISSSVNGVSNNHFSMRGSIGVLGWCYGCGPSGKYTSPGGAVVRVDFAHPMTCNPRCRVMSEQIEAPK